MEPGARPRPGALLLVCVVLAGAALAALLSEVGLRVGGYRSATFPIVQFGWPEPHEIEDVFVPDRELFWVTRDYGERLAEARRRPPAVVFMGDSCTQFGTWPQLALERLAARDASLGHGVVLAVAGWSSEQGLRQLRRDVLPLRPGVVTIYFGWNDHWIAFGRPDAEVRAGRVGFWLYEHLRLMQLIRAVRLGVSREADGSTLRVPLDRYRANLETMADLARQAGIRPVFITAPSSHARGREPAYLARRHLRRLEDLVPLHAAYVEATRAAAAAANAELCDAAAAFRARPGPLRRYFTRDGIHLSAAGSRVLAEIVTACLAPRRTKTQEHAGAE